MTRCRALALVSLLFGCRSTPLPNDCPACEPPSEALEAASTRSFLVTRVTFAPAVDGVAQGLDLDGFDAGDGGRRGVPCEEQQPDYRSPFGAVLGGVDNAAQGLITTVAQISDGPTFEESLDEAVQTDAIRWVIEVGAIDESAPAAQLRLALHVVDESARIERDASGRAIVGQTLRTRRVAQSDAFVSADAAFGRVAGSPDLGVTGGSVFLIPFHAMQVRGLAVAANPDDPDSLRASLGGSFAIEDLVARSLELADEFDAAELESLFRSIFTSAADLDPGADRTVCEHVSIGLGLEAVRVEREE